MSNGVDQRRQKDAESAAALPMPEDERGLVEYLEALDDGILAAQSSDEPWSIPAHDALWAREREAEAKLKALEPITPELHLWDALCGRCRRVIDHYTAAGPVKCPGCGLVNRCPMDVRGERLEAVGHCRCGWDPKGTLPHTCHRCHRSDRPAAWCKRPGQRDTFACASCREEYRALGQQIEEPP